jgi:predicted transcriptional regulator
MKITPEENDLLLELVNQSNYPSFDPCRHVTAMMLADKLNITHRAAYDRLERLRHKGQLQRERVRLPDGHRVWGYYKE